MKVLSIEQMTKLKELGVDTSKASMAVYGIYAGEKKEYEKEKKGWKSSPFFTSFNN